MSESLEGERNFRNLVAVIFAIVFPTFVTLVYFKWLANHPASVQQTAYSVGKFIQFAFPVVWVFLFLRYWFRRGKNRVVDSDKKSAWMPNWLWSIGFGLDVCIVMAIAYWFLSGSEEIAMMAGRLGEKVAGLGMTSVWKFALVGVFYALVHSLLEEYYWRWFVYDLLKRFVSVPIANVISSLGFMAHHVILLSVYFGWESPMTWLCSAGVAIGGAFWAWLYQKSGTLIWPWVSHMIVDAGLFVLGYFLIREEFFM